MSGSLLDEIHPDWIYLSQRQPTDEDLSRIEEDFKHDAEQIKFNQRLNRLARLCIRLQRNHKRPMGEYLRKIRKWTNTQIQFAVRRLIAAELRRQAKFVKHHPTSHGSRNLVHA